MSYIRAMKEDHMLNKRNRLFCMALISMLALLLTACSQLPNTASNSKFPEKEITLICPWSPGGSSDLISRAVGQTAGKLLAKPMVVVNKDGANGVVSTTEFAKAKPDGYTLSLGTNALFTNQPFVVKNLGYKQEDFEFLMGLTNEPILLVVNANSSYKTLDDLLAAAKEKNSVIRYGNSGIGGVPQLALAYFFEQAGIKAQPVPFKGSAPVLTAILGEHVDAAAVHPGEAIPHIKAGKLRALAISSAQRFTALPDVPTMREKGFDIDMGVKKYIFVPKGLPNDVKETLIDTIQKVIADPEFKKAMADINVMLEPMSGQELTNYFETQKPIMKRLLEQVGKAN